VRNDAVRRPPPVVKQQAVKRFVFGSGEMIAAKVYGTIVVLAILAAGGKAFQNDLWRLVTLVVATVLVLWLSHVYAYGLAESVRTGRRITEFRVDDDCPPRVGRAAGRRRADGGARARRRRPVRGRKTVLAALACGVR
jgi:hypothetical protein